MPNRFHFREGDKLETFRYPFAEPAVELFVPHDRKAWAPAVTLKTDKTPPAPISQEHLYTGISK